ncbi:MAG: hypothetical protein JWN70_3769 [Planctomycetaceae bacterium]|nr:hypothetical protein [Planctomycetaceae bacterium]
MPRKHFVLIWGLIVAVTVGCGGNLKLVPVEGTVKLNGEPLSDARVVFYPEAGGRPSNARTDADGRYSLEYIEGEPGALIGKHKVSISTFVEADPDSTDPLIKLGHRETLPAEYNKQTTLQAELESGSREEVDFDLKAATGS